MSQQHPTGNIIDEIKFYLQQSLQELASDSKGKLIKAAESIKLPYQTPNWAEKTLSSNRDVSLIVYEVKDLVNRYGENWPKHSEKLLKVVWVSYEIEGGSWQNDENVQKVVAFPTHVTKLLACYQSFRDDREAFWLAFPILRSILDLLFAINIDLIKSARKEKSKDKKGKKLEAESDQATANVEQDQVEAEKEELLPESTAETLIPILNELATIKELSIYHKLVKEIATTMLKLFSEHFQHLRTAVLSMAVGAVKSFLTMKVDTALLSGLEQLVTAGFEMFQHYRAVDQLTMMQRLHLQRSPSSPLISYQQLCEASRNIKSVKSNWFLTTVYINNLVKVVYCAWKNYGKTTAESQRILHACIFGDHHVMGLLPLFHKFHRRAICNPNHVMTASLLNGESFVSILKSVAMELVGEIMESIESTLMDQLSTLWREGNEFIKKRSQWIRLFANGQIMNAKEVIDTTVEASLNQFLDLLKGILKMFRYVDEKLKVLQRCFEKIIGHIRGLIQTIDPAITYLQVFTQVLDQSFLKKLPSFTEKLVSDININPSNVSFVGLWKEISELKFEGTGSWSAIERQTLRFMAILSVISQLLNTQLKRVQSASYALFKVSNYEGTVLKHWETMRSDLVRMEDFVKIVAETVEAKKNQQSNQSWFPTSFKMPTFFSSSSKPPTVEEVVNLVKLGLSSVKYLRTTFQAFLQEKEKIEEEFKEGGEKGEKMEVISNLSGDGKMELDYVDLSVFNDVLVLCKDVMVPAFSTIEEQFANFASKGESLLQKEYLKVIHPLQHSVLNEIADRLKSLDTFGCGEWMKTLRGLWSYFCVSREAMNAIREGIKTMIGPGERPELVEEALAASTLEIEGIFDAAIQVHDLSSTTAKKEEIVLMHQQLEKFIAKWKMTSSHHTIKQLFQQQKYTEKVNNDLKKHWLAIEKESVSQIESLVTSKEVMTTIMNNDEELHEDSRKYGIKAHHEELLNGTRQLIAQDTTQDSIQTMKDSCHVVMTGSVASGLAGLAPVLLNYLERSQERVEIANETMLSTISMISYHSLLSQQSHYFNQYHYYSTGYRSSSGGSNSATNNSYYNTTVNQSNSSNTNNNNNTNHNNNSTNQGNNLNQGDEVSKRLDKMQNQINSLEAKIDRLINVFSSHSGGGGGNRPSSSSNYNNTFPTRPSSASRNRWEDRLYQPIRRSQTAREDPGGLYYPQNPPSSPSVKFGRESRFANRNLQLAIAHGNQAHMMNLISQPPPSDHPQRESAFTFPDL